MVQCDVVVPVSLVVSGNTLMSLMDELQGKEGEGSHSVACALEWPFRNMGAEEEEVAGPGGRTTPGGNESAMRCPDASFSREKQRWRETHGFVRPDAIAMSCRRVVVVECSDYVRELLLY